MLKRSIRSWTALVGTAVLLTGGLAAAEEIYTWRTQDGGYSFTDDAKAIPPRYRDRVEVRRLEGLEGYPRFTPKDDEATHRYEERLAARLEYLRALNRQAMAPPPGTPAASAWPIARSRSERIAGIMSSTCLSRWLLIKIMGTPFRAANSASRGSRCNAQISLIRDAPASMAC